METLLRSPRQGEVSVVNWIEGAAKQSDVHRCLNSRSMYCFRPRVSLDSRNPEFWVLGDIHRPNSL
jgi:hypothetical protein